MKGAASRKGPYLGFVPARLHSAPPSAISPGGLGSLKRGWGHRLADDQPAPVLPPPERPTRALKEYGRLVKTLFILRYLESEQLRAEGTTVNNEDIARLSPARYEHLNPYGKYRFEVEDGLSRTRLRPLRPHAEQRSE